MTVRPLERTIFAYRIGDPAGRFPIFDATGSTLSPGRWNSAACPVLYTSEHYSTAMLEKLVHGSGRMPPNQHFIRITLPEGASVEVLDVARLPTWHEPSCATARAFGDTWQQSRRSLALYVPSAVAREDRNILINPQHPDFVRVKAGAPSPVWWDARLFGGA